MTKIEKLVSDAMQEEIDLAICKSFESMCDRLKQATSAVPTSTTNSLTIEKLNHLIETLRPEHAILLNKYVDHGRIFVIENYNYDKFYCKKLIIMNRTYYYSVVKNQLEENDGFNIKVYE